MVNISKIKNICKSKGIKIGYLCEQLGLTNSYLSDVSRGKNTMSDERIHKIASLLDTTYEYLTDQTDNPEPEAHPEVITNKTATTEDDLKVALFGGDGEVTDEMWDEVKQFAEFIKQKQSKK